MKKMKLFYNPHAGEKSFHLFLDDVIRIFQDVGYSTSVFRSNNDGDIPKHLEVMDDDYDAVTVAGGDGTVNQVVHGLMERGLNIPIGVFPAGTANDFGTFLGMHRNIEETARIIAEGNIIPTDVGIVDDKHFINVCGAGLLTNISQNIDVKFKALFGKLAYYIKGIEQLPRFEAIPIKVTNSKEVIEEDIYFFVVLNSAGAGGFEKLVKDASISDGKLDFMAIKACPIPTLAMIFMKILNGEYLNDENVIYFQDSTFQIESRMPLGDLAETDIDGEVGPDLPVTIDVIKHGASFFGTKEVMERMKESI